MAVGLKTKGREEVLALKRRVLRQFTLGRIGRKDKENLIQLLDDLDAYIIKLVESDPNQEEDETLW